MPRRSRCSAAAQALLHPVQAGEPFRLVLAEAMALYARLVAGKRGADVHSWDPQRIDAALAPGTGS
jgi:hypothetical protein